MYLTIAIPTFLREDVLLDTCRQVLAHIDPATMEVLLVDQTVQHEPETEQALADWAKEERIRWIRQQPPSLTEARNRALSDANGEVVLFLDDDIVISPHLFDHHLCWYNGDQIAVVTGEVYNCLDASAPPPLDAPHRGTRRHGGSDQAGPARTTSGGNHSVRRDVALAVGGFDPRFVGSALAEDMDFCRRLLNAGHCIWYDPEAWIIHLGVKTGGCGVSGVRIWPEWVHAGNFMLYAFRHSRAQKNFRSMLWQALRHGPLRKEIVFNPLRWCPAWWGFIRGCVYGWRYRRFNSL